MASGDVVYQALGLKATDVDHSASGSDESAKVNLPTPSDYSLASGQNVHLSSGPPFSFTFSSVSGAGVPSQLLDPTKTYDIVVKEH